MRDVDGAVHRDRQKIADVFADFYQSLYNADMGSATWKPRLLKSFRKEHAEIEMTRAGLGFSSNSVLAEDFIKGDVVKFSDVELDAAIDKLKVNKSSDAMG
eukprot:11595216-Karenia_brevis.AAC.1